MKKFFLTPGPSALFYTVEDHIKSALSENVGSISHRSKEFKAIYQFAEEQLRALLQIPEGYKVLMLSSANEIWERIAQNLVVDNSTHIVNGAFSEKFYNTVQAFGKKAIKIEVPFGQGVDIAEHPFAQSPEVMAFTLNETSTGVMHRADDIYAFRKKYPESLIALDVVSAFPSIAFDTSKVDCFYFSVQKCFGLPAGLGVWVVNEKCLAQYQNVLAAKGQTGYYHDLGKLVKMAKNFQTPETPNIWNIYLLGKVVADMNEMGIDKIQRDTKYKAAVLYQALESNERMRPFVNDKNHRSLSTIVAQTKSASEFLTYTKQKGLVIGGGYGKFKEEHIRIANFPTHSNEIMEHLADLIASF